MTHPPCIPDHELLHPIAAGAYGEVWLARNAIGTLRAVKIVLRDQHAAAESFEREFKGLQKFEPISRTHDGLVDILTLGLLPDGVGFYYVMELADKAAPGPDAVAARAKRLTSIESESRKPQSESESGTPQIGCYKARTLRADLKSRGALTFDEVVGLGLKLTAALTHLHAQGLLHRDVKPSNILFIGGEPKLADAGLVAAVDDARSLVGTAGYIAPEGPGTPQGDLYALGKVMYEAAFGKDRQEFPALPADVASRPDHTRLLELNEIIATACAHDPKQRYASAERMLADLHLLESKKSIKQQRARQRLWFACKRVGLTAVLIMLAGILVSRLSPRGTDEYVQSKNPEANQWVRDGNLALWERRPARLRRAEECFRNAIRLDPTLVPAYYGLATADLLLDDDSHMADLRTTCETLKKIARNSSDTVQFEALLKWFDGRYLEARADAKRATELPASCREARAWSHGAYGLLLQYTGDPDGALREYEEAYKIHPQDPTIRDHLGQPYLMRGNLAEALKCFQRSLDLQPNHPNGLYWKARTLEEMGSFDKAIDICQERDLVMEALDAKRREFYVGLRHAFDQRGTEGYWRYRLDEMLEDSPKEYYQLASLCARLKNWPAAYDYLERAVANRDPQLANLRFDLCWDRNNEHFQDIARKIGLMN